MSFYEQDGGVFVSTPWSRGPWSLDSQHGGPPAALLGRAIELLPTDVPMQVSRFTIEILRPIPVVPLRVESKVVRPGKRVQFCEAALLNGADPVALVRAWRIRAGDGEAPLVTDGDVPRAPFECPELEFPPEPKESYMHGMEWRTADGKPFNGPSTVWFRARIPLVAGEEPSPLQRLLLAADCGNGISAEVDFSSLFINVDLSVHVTRLPKGEFVALRARTRIEPTGVGVASSSLWDEHGRLGTGAQSLYVGPKPTAVPREPQAFFRADA